MRQREFCSFFLAVSSWPARLPLAHRSRGGFYRPGNAHTKESAQQSEYDGVVSMKRAKMDFVEGANLSVDADGWGLTEEQFPVHAPQTSSKPELMSSICSGDSAVRAAQKATKTISILANASDMVSSPGLRAVAYLTLMAIPLGLAFSPTQLDGKRQEITDGNRACSATHRCSL